MNYTELCAEISSYIENTFAVADLNTIIEQAEERIYNSVQLPALRRNQTGSLTTNNKYLTLPGDFLSAFSLSVIDITGTTIGSQSLLLNKDVNFMREAFPNPSASGRPTHYAIFDATSLIIGPTPDMSYGVELHYYFYPETIVTASTSWLGENFPTALLYGCLVEANSFIKGEQTINESYTKRYMEALGLLKQLGDGKNRRDAYRSGQIRLPVG